MPFRKEVEERLSQFAYHDQVEWSGLNSWIEAFSSALGFRERFQEIWIDDRTLPGQGSPADLTIRVNPESIGKGERVEVWLNGFRAVFPPVDSKEEAWELPLGDHLVDGDNLLVVRKVGQAHTRASFDVTDLFRTNPLAFTLRAGEGRPYSVSRSLSAVVENYSLYVTLRRPEKTRDNALDCDEHLRLAVRVDAVERFLNETPFLIALAENLPGPDGKPAARAKGDVVFASRGEDNGWKPGQFVRLDTRSSQTVDISVRGWVANLASDVAGIQLGFEKTDQTLPFEFRSRLHFVRERSGPFHVTMRATAASSKGDFKVPLLAGSGVRVQADLAGLITELALQWVNNRFLKPEEPRMLARERLGRLLAVIGGLGKGLDDQVELRRAFVTSVGGHPWLVLTLGLPKTAGKGPALPLLPASAADGRIIDLVAREVPAALAAEFAQLGRANGDAPETTPLGTIDELAFSLTPPKDWWEYPKAADPLVDRASAVQPAEGMARAWKRLLAKSDRSVRLSLCERDLVGLLAGLSPAVRWKAAAREAALTLTGDRSSFGLAKDDAVRIDELEVVAQKARAIGLEAKGLRIIWDDQFAPSFQGRLSAREVQLGALDRRLTQVQGEVTVTPAGTSGKATLLKLTGPTARVNLPGVEFGLAAEQGPWVLELSPDGRLSGQLQVKLDNEAGRADFELLPDRVRLLAVDLDLSRVRGIQERIHGAINNAIGFNVDMDLERLRVDSTSNKLSVRLSLKKRMISNFPRIDEEVKFLIQEEIDLRQALQNKRLVWRVKIGPVDLKIAEFNLPLDDIRRAVDLDAILGEGRD